MLCKIIDELQPGLVDWKKIDQAPKNDFVRGENNRLFCEYAKKLGLKFIGVGASDLTRGNQKVVLALLGKLKKMHEQKASHEKVKKVAQPKSNVGSMQK